MREWYLSKLVAGHQTRVAALQRQGGSEQEAQDAAKSLLITGMGYPETWSPDNWSDLMEQVLADEARNLGAADLYVLTPQMADVVTAAALSLTIDDLMLMTEEDLDSPSGLVVLPHPLLVRSINGGIGDDRAYLWRTPAFQAIPAAAAGGPAADSGGWVRRPAVRVSTYHDCHGPVQPDSFRDFAAYTRAQGHPLPPLLVDGMRCLPFQMTLTEEQRANLVAYGETARTTGALHRALANRTGGYDEERVIGEYVPGSEVVDEDDTFQFRFLYAFWRLCAQQVAVTSTVAPGHAARLQADEAGVSGDVRVVQLRRATTDPAAAAGGGSERWHHRWVVRMHKVRQWYPSEQRHKILYRGPYVKGPDGKPLLGGEVVRGLTR
jgi:ethanolamine utilization microcompartment shell protein EutS